MKQAKTLTTQANVSGNNITTKLCYTDKKQCQIGKNNTSQTKKLTKSVHMNNSTTQFKVSKSLVKIVLDR